MTRVIAVRLLKAGDVIERFPYAGDEALPIVVTAVLPAKRKGSVIVEGTDAQGHYVLVPCGRASNHVEVADTGRR